MDVYKIIVILACVVFIYYYYKYIIREGKIVVNEGFSQTERFVLKNDTEIYDDFYAEIYDELMMCKETAKFQADKIIEMTMPTKSRTTMLDIGSGTGELVNYLNSLGYIAYGLEQSSAMVEVTNQKGSSDKIKQGTFADPMNYEHSTFSHIFCTGFTLYEIKKKLAFYKNCHHWLKNNGYFIVHLVDEHKFHGITPALLYSAKKHDLLEEAYGSIQTSQIDYPHFTYKSEYKEGTRNKWVHKETFTDKSTQHVRQNEKTLYIEPLEEIIQNILSVGFIGRGYFSLEHDKYQYLYIFEKI